MRKLGILVLLAALLAGCGAQESFETVADEHLLPVSATVGEVSLALPEEAKVPAMKNTDGSELYLCDGYALTLQTLAAGNLGRTVAEATGFSKEDLQIIQTRQGAIKRYETVWTAAGESEPQVGRLCILDDGNYHYVLTAMAGASGAGDLQKVWNDIFSSFRLVKEQISTDS